MAVERLLPWSELLQKLVRLCDERRTGTLFIAISDNRLARFALKEGAIVAIAFHRNQGMAAVGMMSSIVASSCQFNDQMMLISGGEQALPPTPELLRILAEEPPLGLLLPASSPASAAAPAPAPAKRAVEHRSSYLDISELLQIKEIIATGLIEIMGPMGQLVCDTYLAALTDRKSVVMAIDSVAAEIDDAELERQFKSSIAEKIKSLQKSRRG